MNAVVLAVARQFTASANPINIEPLGNGLINATYRVKTTDEAFVLQRINAQVFPEPRKVIENLLALSQHIQAKPAETVKLKIPALIPTRDGQAYYQDEDGEIWRALELIAPAQSREHIANQEEAGQVGRMLAHFHGLCRDLAPNRLHDTLPGFHITPGYYDQYQVLLDQPLRIREDSDFRRCTGFIAANQTMIAVLEQARRQGELRERVIHGDPKLNNFLFYPESIHIVSLIDLDTVKPGLLHYDIGDCLRSGCHQRDHNRFDLAICRALLGNYLREAGQFFNEEDYDYLYSAIWLIPFELGLRFFSDYLAGDCYFKINRPRQNLERALAQFALCENITAQQAEISALVEQLRATNHRMN